MPTSPATLIDAHEAQNAIRALGLQITDAVAQADANLVRHLSVTRHVMLRKVCGPDGHVRFSDRQRAELINESEAWITTLQAHQHRITAEIESLRARRNTKRLLTRAYRVAPPTVAQCFAHCG